MNKHWREPVLQSRKKRHSAADSAPAFTRVHGARIAEVVVHLQSF